jgi:ribonuclease Z
MPDYTAREACRHHTEQDGRCAVGRVICLGTGDPLNAERAQTCLAVQLPGEEAILFDASSGTLVLGRLQTAGIPLERIHHLFVSHRHFDHVGGLAPLLISTASLPEAHLTVHALSGTMRALRELLALTIPGVEDWLGERLCWRELAPESPIQAGDVEVVPFSVDHSVECVGYRIEQGGSTMVFAADTRPCQGVVEHAKGADLLIHEAYGTGGEAEAAHFRGHSTAADAGAVAREAGVSRLVLTHIRANRFADPGELVAEAGEVFGGPVEAARDLDAFEF